MAKVLVIDDEEAVRRMLRAGLELADWEVFEASDALEALEACRRDRFDVVLTDICMPRKTGLELIEDLRREFPGIKILAMSGAGLGSLDVLETARTLGACKTFPKPFSVSELLKAVREIVEEGG